LGERFLQCRRADPEVRRRPDHAAVAHDKSLRSFVTDAKPGGDRVGHLPVRLNRHHRVARVAAFHGQVRQQLIERLGTDAAGIAVFEEHQGSVAGLSEGMIELV
jgi:hypothetical protein